MSSGEDLGVGEKSIDTADLTALSQLVTSTYFIPIDPNQLFSPLDAIIAGAKEPFIAAGQAFRANITGLLSTIAVPYTIANASAMDRNWQRIHIAARIRSRVLQAKSDETEEELNLRRDRVALARAKEEMDKFLHSLEGRDVIIRDTLTFLESLHSDGSLVPAVNELLLQGIVLCWGGFEVLARDSFIAYLNVNPSRSLSLQADAVAKRRFELSKVPLETLASYNFDLSTRMGTLLAQEQDLSDIYSIKAAYEALFPANSQLHNALNDPGLRFLSMRRNLIVHQRGIVDETYLTATNCAQNVGERLALHPDAIESHLRTTVSAATAVLGAVSATI